MKKKHYAVIVISILFTYPILLRAQDLELPALSSGSLSLNNMQFNLGLPFVFHLEKGSSMLSSISAGYEVAPEPWVPMVPIKTDDRVAFYPNPVVEDFYFALFDYEKEYLSLKVIDLSGRILSEESFEYTLGATYFTNLSYLIPGTYILQISEPDGTEIDYIQILKE